MRHGLSHIYIYIYIYIHIYFLRERSDLWQESKRPNLQKSKLYSGGRAVPFTPRWKRDPQVQSDIMICHV